MKKNASEVYTQARAPDVVNFYTSHWPTFLRPIIRALPFVSDPPIPFRYKKLLIKEISYIVIHNSSQ